MAGWFTVRRGKRRTTTDHHRLDLGELMATMRISSEALTFHFEGMERLWLGRQALTVPLRSVRQVTYADRPLRLAHGLRRGYVISGVTKIGVWSLLGRRRQLVYARRGVPGLHLRLDRTAVDGAFDEVVFSTPDAARLVHAIERSIAAAGHSDTSTRHSDTSTDRSGTAIGPAAGGRA